MIYGALRLLEIYEQYFITHIALAQVHFKLIFGEIKFKIAKWLHNVLCLKALILCWWAGLLYWNFRTLIIENIREREKSGFYNFNIMQFKDWLILTLNNIK